MTCPFFDINWITQDQLSFKGSGRIELWDIRAKTLLRILSEGSIYAISPDGNLLASATGSQGITIRDFRSGEELANIAAGPDYFGELAFSPNGKLLASLTDHGIVMVWDLIDFYSD
jgi:WD40 repeat protein